MLVMPSAYPDPNKRNLHVVIEKDMYVQLKKRAASERRTVSEVVRMILEENL